MSYNQNLKTIVYSIICRVQNVCHLLFVTGVYTLINIKSTYARVWYSVYYVDGRKAK